MRRDRPRSRRTGETGDEVASPHWRCPLAKDNNPSTDDTTIVQRETAKGPMSVMGQKETSRPEIAMSALPPKADIAEDDRHVR
jgi:hypothetical protein